jgi:pSer/pThr/pTyr-binding forkhead associated (FHA) protein
MKVKLLVEEGSSRAGELVLKRPQTFVGRQRGCGLRIPSSSVSRRHCVLQIADGGLTVEDLDSVNGTYVNGERVSGRQLVRPGDRLQVGPVKFRVDYQAKDQPADRKQRGKPESDAELEVLPLADEDAETAQAVALEELPAEPPQPKKKKTPPAQVPTQVLPARNDDKVGLVPESDADVPVLEVEVEEDAAGWKLPEADELRDILSQMDVDDRKQRPKSRKE